MRIVIKEKFFCHFDPRERVEIELKYCLNKDRHERNDENWIWIEITAKFRLLQFSSCEQRQNEWE